VRSASRGRKLVALCTLALLPIWLAPLAGDAPAAPASNGEAAPAVLWPPFQHAPLDGPLITTGSFGEYRPGRFHAGLDLSTGEVTGKPVYAPLDGWIERIRTSGVGYGRSLYLHSSDGRLILLGHLDAFDEPLASYVAAAQDSSGQYEQDLWPERSRFRVSAGQRLGWSGRSGGVGQPHLHLEIRRGDMAINPLLAGASVEDTTAPEITGITIEPRTASSRVNGRAAPLRLPLGAGLDTVRIEGLARVEIEARDPGARRADMQPYAITMRWGGQFVRCAFDSLSWATDMPEGPLVFDAGAVNEERRHAVRMWAPSEFRPRAIRASAVPRDEAGDLGSLDSSGLQRVEIEARDLGERVTRRAFIVEFRPPLERIGFFVGCRPTSGVLPGFGWLAGVESCYGPGAGWDSLRAETLGVASRVGDLIPLGRSIRIGPEWMPLRKPISLRATVPLAHPDPRLGLYVRRAGEWELLDANTDTSTRAQVDVPHLRDEPVWLQRSDEEWSHAAWIAHPSHLGQFAFFEDRAAPRILALRPPRSRGSATPYSRWALEARITELGSGMNARASGFTVDGKRRPTEWDAVDRKLRWKPRAAPKAGTHRYVVIAVDKAGNERRVSGSFVIN
jgi:hypothetical protein